MWFSTWKAGTGGPCVLGEGVTGQSQQANLNKTTIVHHARMPDCYCILDATQPSQMLGVSVTHLRVAVAVAIPLRSLNRPVTVAGGTDARRA